MSTAPLGTLLVVDDNPATLYSTSRVLRGAGYTVFEAATGTEALELAPRGLDLVVLDINLPDIDGFEVCRRLRTFPATSNTPVVHLSASFVDDVDKVHGLEQGADGYLTHPVEPLVLIATVKAFLRARTAERLRSASEAKFKAVFDHALHGIALLDKGMTFLEVNQAMSYLLGYDAAEIVGQHLSAFLPPDFERHVAEIDRDVTKDSGWRATFPARRPDARQIELEWTISMHTAPDIRLAIVADVTERREIEAERERLLASERAARGEAERANRAKDEFLAALSHELRTPLNAIVGWSQLLKRKEFADPDVALGVAAIERNAQVQAQLISDLLDVSRITTGKLTLDVQPFDPAQAVEIAVDSVRATAEARGVQIKMDLLRGAEPVMWDPVRFQQVVWNLLDNAIKFSPAGGTVDLQLSSTAEGIQLSVRDAGRGVTAEFLPHVFDRFRQEDASTRRRHGGMGLGLAIVRNLVEAHGGTVQALSDGEGRGAKFVVSMPRVRPTDGQRRADERGSANLSGVRVLVVDDDQDARLLVERVLRDAGASVAGAPDAATALDQLDSFAPHLLVSDIGMPGEDGYDLIRQIRQREDDRAALPAVALTAFARDTDRQLALEAGYQRHLAKPINAAQLLGIVADLTSPSST